MNSVELVVYAEDGTVKNRIVFLITDDQKAAIKLITFLNQQASEFNKGWIEAAEGRP